MKLMTWLTRLVEVGMAGFTAYLVKFGDPLKGGQPVGEHYQLYIGLVAYIGFLEGLMWYARRRKPNDAEAQRYVLIVALLLLVVMVFLRGTRQYYE